MKKKLSLLSIILLPAGYTCAMDVNIWEALPNTPRTQRMLNALRNPNDPAQNAIRTLLPPDPDLKEQVKVICEQRIRGVITLEQLRAQVLALKEGKQVIPDEARLAKLLGKSGYDPKYDNLKKDDAIKKDILGKMMEATAAHYENEEAIITKALHGFESRLATIIIDLQDKRASYRDDKERELKQTQAEIEQRISQIQALKAQAHIAHKEYDFLRGPKRGVSKSVDTLMPWGK